MEKKTSELTGVALDWAVAKAVFDCRPWRVPEEACGTWYAGECDGGVKDWSPSTDWGQCGPLIDKYAVALIGGARTDPTRTRCAHFGDGSASGYGPTNLIAACRAIVAAELGDTVDIPDELEG